MWASAAAAICTSCGPSYVVKPTTEFPVHLPDGDVIELRAGMTQEQAAAVICKEGFFGFGCMHMEFWSYELAPKPWRLECMYDVVWDESWGSMNASQPDDGSPKKPPFTSSLRNWSLR